MILLWGISGDSPLSLVRQALERLGADVMFLDQQEVMETDLELRLGGYAGGTLRVTSQTIELGAIRSAYVRPYDWRRMRVMADVAEGTTAWSHAAHVDDALLCWTEVTPALVINRPSAMGSNNSKPYQSALINSYGIDVPETLITTDAKAAMAFWEKHGTVVYKSISAVRSIVTRLTPEHCARLDDLGNCPTQFQEYIPGTDYRLHVVGDEDFACEIACTADDYRYARRSGEDVLIRPCLLPQDLRDRCRALVEFMGLHFAGIDLRRTPKGQWYCFEVNPSPGFSFYEEATGQPISQVVAHVLATA